MVKYEGQNVTQDNRGIFTRFLDPLMRSAMGITNSPHKAIVSSIQKTITDLSDEISETSSSAMKLNSAEGSYLDLWGRGVGVNRKVGEDDEEYRERITKYITVLRVTKPAIEDALKDYLGDDNAYVHIYEPYTNIFYLNRSLLNGDDRLQGNYYRYAVIEVTIDRDFNREEVLELLAKFKANGVMVYLNYNPSTNPNATVLEDLFLYHKVDTTQYVADYFSGFSLASNKMITPSTGRIIPNRGDIFRTNNSNLNSLDVLAGGDHASGNISPHAMFYADDTFIPAKDKTPVEMSKEPNNAGFTAMEYTTLSVVGGSSVKMPLFEYRPFYMSYNLRDFYSKLSLVSFATKPMKYIRIDIHDSKRGLDVGEITVRDRLNRVVSTGAVVSHYDNKTGGFTKYVNGSNIVDKENRNATLLMELEEPQVLQDVKIQTVLSDATVSIAVADDDSKYYSIYYGGLQSGEPHKVVDHNSTDSELVSLLSSTLRNPIFQAVFTNYELTEINLDVYNYQTASWETFSEVTPNRVNNVVNPITSSGLQDYLNDVGSLTIRVIPTSNKAEINMNFLGLSLTDGVLLQENLEMGLETFSLGIQRGGSLSDLNMQVVQEHLVDSIGTYPLNKLRFFLEPVGEEDRVGYFTLTEGMLQDDPRGFNRGVFFSGITGEGSYHLTLADGTIEQGSIDVSGAVGYINLQKWRDDIKELLVSFNNYLIVGVDILDYKTGKWESQEIGEGYKIYRKVPKEGFSFDNPYGDGTDLTLMLDDFFTTTYSFSERQALFEEWLTSLNETLQVEVAEGVNSHIVGYADPYNAILAPITGKVSSNVLGVFSTNNSLINSDAVLAGGLTSAGTPSNHALFLSSQNYTPKLDATALSMTTEQGNTNLSPAEYGIVSHTDNRSISVNLGEEDAMYMGYDLMDFAETFGSRMVDNEQVRQVTLQIKGAYKGIDLTDIALYNKTGQAVAISSAEFVDAHSNERQTLPTNAINLPHSSGGYITCYLQDVSEVSNVYFKTTKPVGEVRIALVNMLGVRNVVATYLIEEDRTYPINNRLDDRDSLPNRLVALTNDVEYVVTGYLKKGEAVRLQLWNYSTSKWETFRDTLKREIRLSERVPLNLLTFNDFVNTKGTFLVRVLPTKGTASMDVAFTGASFTILDVIQDELTVGCDVDSENYTERVIPQA